LRSSRIPLGFGLSRSLKRKNMKGTEGQEELLGVVEFSVASVASVFDSAAWSPMMNWRSVMKVVRRSMVLAGIAALGLSGACAKGGDASTARADSGRADSTPGVASGAAPDSTGTNGSAAKSAGSAGTSTSGATTAAATPATPATGGVSVTTGVYTAAQAARGAEVYTSSCGQCHTMGQHSGTAFATAWNNRRLFDLYDIVHNTMPLDNPGGLSDQEYIDVIAYMLQLNGVPAGKSALQADASALKGLRIDVKPSAGQ
jgi:mono/diheme cytochrome c family protein